MITASNSFQMKQFPSLNSRFWFRFPLCGISQSISVYKVCHKPQPFLHIGGVVCYVEDCKKARTPAWAERCCSGMETR